MQILPPQDQTEQDPVWDYTIPLGIQEPLNVERAGLELRTGAPRSEPLGGYGEPAINFRLIVTYRERQDSWYFQILTEDDQPILSGVRFTTDIFPAMYSYELSEYFPGQQFLTLLDLDANGTEASYEDLGRSKLIVHSGTLDFLDTVIGLIFEGETTFGRFDFEGADRPARVVINP